MKIEKRIIAFVFVAILSFCNQSFADELKVLTEDNCGKLPFNMMKDYLWPKIDIGWDNWQKNYERLKTADQIERYQKIQRDRFIRQIGGLPEKTPLNPKVTGILKRPGYRVEKILFESQPDFYVTAILFVPESEKFKAPYPGVLVACGHYMSAKAWKDYQAMGALLALNGMVAMVFDPIEQGERIQNIEILNDKGKPKIWGTVGHNQLALSSILLGQNVARIELWDGIRAIDYLVSRPEIDPDRIGCTGNSGGGTQTAYLMALDDRVKAAAPSCYLHRLGYQIKNARGDAEQYLYNQMNVGIDHPDFLIMRAPIPILMCVATRDFFDIEEAWRCFRYGKRIYTRLGFAERIDILENDARHNYNKTQREGVVRWMSRWLLGKDEPITEPDIKLFSEKELQVTKEGYTVLIEGAKSTYDLNREYNNQLSIRRQKLWNNSNSDELLSKIRKLTGIKNARDLPQPEVEETRLIKKDGYKIKKLIIKPEIDICLPALLYIPDKCNKDQLVLYVNESGKDSEPERIKDWLTKGKMVLAVDLRGTGETKEVFKRKSYHISVGDDWNTQFAAYLLGKSYLAMRAEDIIVCAKYAKDNLVNVQGEIEMVSVGNVGLSAIHAAALESQLFSKIAIEKAIMSWSEIIESKNPVNQLVNVVQGGLTLYDLPDLIDTLNDKIKIISPVKPEGRD